jgi:hypothetical protein
MIEVLEQAKTGYREILELPPHKGVVSYRGIPRVG